MRKMLFETSLKGHRLEYLHHIYVGMLQHKENDYVIIVPQEFEKIKSLYEWPKAENITIHFLKEKIDIGEEGGALRQSLRRAKLLRKYIIQENAESVFLNVLMAYLPALGFLVPRGVKVSGIIYNIYIYNWNSFSLKSKIQNIAKYLIMRFSSCVNVVYILNDATSAEKLNDIFHTHKFQYITDPYNKTNHNPKSKRAELGVKDDEMVFLHFGGLNKRKGTLDILKAIPLLSDDKQNKCVFVFAGKIYDAIREEFYMLKEHLPKNAHVIVYDQFCSNELLEDLCETSDFILIPYHSTSQSSGLLGHAAHFHKPVIGPSDGLIGNLIKENDLGITLPKISAYNIAQAISTVRPYKIESDYVHKTEIANFIEQLFNAF